MQCIRDVNGEHQISIFEVLYLKWEKNMELFSFSSRIQVAKNMQNKGTQRGKITNMC